MDPGALAPTQEWLFPRDRRLDSLGEVGADCECGQKMEVGCEGGQWRGSDPFSPSWLYPSVQLSSPAAEASTRDGDSSRGTSSPQGAARQHIPAPRAPHARHLSAPNSAPPRSGPRGQGAPGATKSRGRGELPLSPSPPAPSLLSRGRTRRGSRGGALPSLRAPHQARACPYSLQWAKTGRTCPMAPLGTASGPPPTPAAPPWAWGRGHSSPPSPHRRRRHPCRLLLPGCSGSRRHCRRPLLRSAAGGATVEKTLQRGGGAR